MKNSILSLFIYREPNFPLEIVHEQRAITITVNEPEQGEGVGILINGVSFNDLPEARAREREPLARTKPTIHMSGNEK